MKAEIEQRIVEKFRNHLKESNLRTLSVQDWVNIFSGELSTVFSTRIYSLNPQYLYRARPNTDNGKPVEFFDYANQLWAPPKSKVHRQGRCNKKGESLLYVSCYNGAIPIFELKPETGSEITLIEYKTNSKIKILGAVGVNDIIKIGHGFDSLFKDHFTNSSEESILFDDILSSIFKSKKENTEELPIYNLTNAITQIFLNNQKAKFLPDYKKPPKFSGLIYPSVETVMTGVNIVLNPKDVKNQLIPNILYKYKIINCVDEHHYQILLTHQTNKIYSNGELSWESVREETVQFITDLPSIQNE